MNLPIYTYVDILHYFGAFFNSKVDFFYEKLYNSLKSEAETSIMKENQQLFEFIRKSPSAYHTVDTVKSLLISEGYTELSPMENWKDRPSGKYFTVKNGTSLIAFRTRKCNKGFMIVASHSDSPAFRLKLGEETVGAYTRISTEKYGGMIHYTWLDRPLSLAGRVVVKTDKGLKSCLVNLDKDIATIPSVAIHLNRGVNEGYKFNPATDLQALVGSAEAKGSIISEIARMADTAPENIVSHDLFLYNRDEGKVFGVKDEYILSPRLDDLECVFSSLMGFLSADESESVPVLAIFDNEEVGSETKQGAASTFLYDTLSAIAGDSYRSMLANSFMVSADNAHAKHPNHPELSDAENAPIMNGGIVIKWNANQKYTTDAVSDSVFKTVCERANVKTQTYYNRADMPGGSTLGSIANTKVSIPTVDIGLAELAMHSANETAGAYDVDAMISAITEFYSTTMLKKGTKVYI